MGRCGEVRRKRKTSTKPKKGKEKDSRERKAEYTKEGFATKQVNNIGERTYQETDKASESEQGTT